MSDTQIRPDDVQPAEQDRYAEPVARLHWVEHPERRTLMPGEEVAVVLIGVVDGERVALSAGNEVQWERTAEDAGGLLENYARPDGPLQHTMFSAVGLRGLNDDGEGLWEELHYTEQRPVKHQA